MPIKWMLIFFVFVISIGCRQAPLNLASSSSLEIHPLENAEGLAAALPNFYAPEHIGTADINHLLIERFRNITPIQFANFFNAVKDLRVTEQGSAAARPEFSICTCQSVIFSSRILGILMQGNELLARVLPERRAEKLVHVAFGEGQYLHTYMLALALSHFGFNSVDIIGIGDWRDAWEEHGAAYQVAFAAIPGYSLRHFFSAAEYVADVNAGAVLRAQSFDAVDVGPHNQSINGESYGFTAVRVLGTRKGRAGYGNYFIVATGNGQNSCAGNFNDIYDGFNGSPIADADDRLKRTFAQPLIDSFCRAIAEAVDVQVAGADFRAQVTAASTQWFIERGITLHQPNGIRGVYANSWFEFAGIINNAKAANFPTLILAIQDDILSGPTLYDDYFPVLGGLNLSVPSFEGYPRT